MNENSTVSRFKIGRWIVDIDRGGIVEGDKFTRLEPKPMEVLVLLAKADGAITSAAELKEKVWGETHVVDEVVKRCVSQIRAAFGDNAQEQRVVATTPKRGYSIAEKVDWHFEEDRKISLFRRFINPKWQVIAPIVGIVIVGLFLFKQSSPQPSNVVDNSPVDSLAAAYSTASNYYYSYEFEDNESAIAIYRRIIVEHPGEAAAYAGLANALLQRVIRWSEPKTLLDEAKAAALTALEIDPLTPEAHKALGLYFQELKQFPESIRAYQKAVDIDPTYWAAINNIGEVYYEAGNLAAAKTWLECALQISPNQEQSLAALGQIQFRLQNYQAAEKYFGDVLIVAPFSQDALIGLSFLALYNQQPQSAISYCKRLSEVWPDIQDCNLNSGIAFMMLGDTDQAMRIFQELSQDASPYWQVIGKIRMHQLDAMKSNGQQNADDVADMLVQIDQVLTDGLFTPGQASWFKALIASSDHDISSAIEYLDDAVAEGHSDQRWDMIEPGFSMLRNDIRFINLMQRDLSKTSQVNDIGSSGSNDLLVAKQPSPSSCKPYKFARN